MFVEIEEIPRHPHPLDNTHRSAESMLCCYQKVSTVFLCEERLPNSIPPAPPSILPPCERKKQLEQSGSWSCQRRAAAARVHLNTHLSCSCSNRPIKNENSNFGQSERSFQLLCSARAFKSPLLCWVWTFKFLSRPVLNLLLVVQELCCKNEVYFKDGVDILLHFDCFLFLFKKSCVRGQRNRRLQWCDHCYFIWTQSIRLPQNSGRHKGKNWIESLKLESLFKVSINSVH